MASPLPAGSDNIGFSLVAAACARSMFKEFEARSMISKNSPSCVVAAVDAAWPAEPEMPKKKKKKRSPKEQ